MQPGAAATIYASRNSQSEGRPSEDKVDSNDTREPEREEPTNNHGPSNVHDDAPMTLPYQREVKQRYESNNAQVGIAGLIVVNFLVTCLQKEIDPQEEDYKQVWTIGNMTFNIIFTIELAINLYGRWWCVFWQSKWNIFDFVVVAIGIMDMAWTDMPGPLRLIRMLRAFRVFRLFNRVESMRKIIESIAHAVPGVLNAFLINFILICIYAVLSVDFYSELYCDADKMENVKGQSETARGYCWGNDYYGTFTKALYTMFQVLTGESWSEMCARPALAYFMDREDPLHLAITYIFFYSFVLINSFVLLNVVVAVLMDGMNNTSGDDAPEDETDSTKIEHIAQAVVDIKELLRCHEEKFDMIMAQLSKMKSGPQSFEVAM